LGRDDGQSQDSVGDGEVGPGAGERAEVPALAARSGTPTPGTPVEEARRRRLAAALRENLKRRKDQSRQKRELQKPGPAV
jgi:hypothetical protein